MSKIEDLKATTVAMFLAFCITFLFRGLGHISLKERLTIAVIYVLLGRFLYSLEKRV